MKPENVEVELYQWWSPPARGRGLKHLIGLGPGSLCLSPPARGRGLKQRDRDDGRTALRVAPRAGAWIETVWDSVTGLLRKSPPARGRGLKHASEATIRRMNWSPPARGRGLKHDQVRIELFLWRRPPRGGVD